MKVFTCTDFRSVYHNDGTTYVCPAFALVTAVDADQARDVLFDRLVAIGLAPTPAEKAGWTMLLRQHTYGPTCLLLSVG